jgi:hypothetical protein
VIGILDYRVNPIFVGHCGQRKGQLGMKVVREIAIQALVLLASFYLLESELFAQDDFLRKAMEAQDQANRQVTGQVVLSLIFFLPVGPLIISFFLNRRRLLNLNSDRFPEITPQKFIEWKNLMEKSNNMKILLALGLFLFSLSGNFPLIKLIAILVLIFSVFGNPRPKAEKILKYAGIDKKTARKRIKET